MKKMLSFTSMWKCISISPELYILVFLAVNVTPYIHVFSGANTSFSIIQYQQAILRFSSKINSKVIKPKIKKVTGARIKTFFIIIEHFLLSSNLLFQSFESIYKLPRVGNLINLTKTYHHKLLCLELRGRNSNYESN